ncbi:cysteine rich repeat-containing protein [Acuticoccus mangrovi]|uniref:Cysteine rich repeat-containing protein n=1 Tax=Acuticoccus mangrovi TaxID=2796142 RepID=A0A934MFP0_9HYPH|nr:cysteine rich repeat-containing protein [Acuticoccus mangrovi]MBJ3775135.1 cysteine rich repeat-containing protein [Acuticoccus mangrovi]
MTYQKFAGRAFGALTLGAVLLPAGLAMAQTAQPRITQAEAMQIASACKADIQRICPGVQPGGGRVMACMRAKASEVSPGCQAVIGEILLK